MKHHLRIPTPEQFAYIETEFEGTAEEAVEEYRRITRLVKGEEGLGIKNAEFLELLDALYNEGEIAGDPGITEQMSKSQAEIIRAFKLVIRRNK